MADISKKEVIRTRVRDIKSFYNIDVARRVETGKFRWANGVCCDDNGFLYLTCKQMKRFLAFNNELECIKEICFNEEPNSLVYLRGRFYIQFRREKSMCIIDPEGKVIDRLENRLAESIDFSARLMALGTGDAYMVLVDLTNNYLHFIDENSDHVKRIHVKDFAFRDEEDNILRKIICVRNELFLLDLYGNIYSVKENGDTEVVFKPGILIRDATDAVFVGQRIYILERSFNHLYTFDRATGNYARLRITHGNVFRMGFWGKRLLIPLNSEGNRPPGSQSGIMAINIT